MNSFKNTGLIILTTLFCFMFIACEDKVKTLDASFFDYEYFPMEIGDYWVYRVDSTTVESQGANIRKSKNFVREEIIESFINAEGKTVFMIQRSLSDSLNGRYLVRDIWTAEMTDESAFRIEENLRFNKLSFPIDLDDQWQGNLFDNLVEQVVAGETMWVYKDWGDYQVIADGIERVVNGQLYTGVVAVKQADHDFGLERRFAIEYYAPEVGLIERQMAIYDTQCVCPGQTWEEKASAGFTLNQILLEHN